MSINLPAPNGKIVTKIVCKQMIVASIFAYKSFMVVKDQEICCCRMGKSGVLI